MLVLLSSSKERVWGILLVAGGILAMMIASTFARYVGQEKRDSELDIVS